MFKVGAVSHGVGCGSEIPASYSNVAGDFVFFFIESFLYNSSPHLLSGAMCWIDWVMSTVPMSKYDVDFEETQEDTLGLRQSGNDYQVIMFDIILDITIFKRQSINGLTQNDCGDFKQNNPDLFR